jgi:hypothetical protein
MSSALGAATSQLGKRHLRRSEISRIITRLGDVLLAEECYRDNIPENLQGSVRYDDACTAIDTLEEVIGLLGDTY